MKERMELLFIQNILPLCGEQNYVQPVYNFVYFYKIMKLNSTDCCIMYEDIVYNL